MRKIMTAVTVLLAACLVAAAPLNVCAGDERAAPSSSFLDLARHLGRKWYGIYFLDQKIGYAEVDIARSRRGGGEAVTVTLKLVASVAMMGAPQELSITESRTYVPGKGLAAFLSETSSGGGRMTITGEALNGKMRVMTSVGGNKTTSVIKRPEEKFEDYIAEERLVSGDAAVGDELSFSQYQPTLQRSITAVCRVKEIRERVMRGVASKLYVIETTLAELDIVSTTLVGEDGEVLQAQVAGVYTMLLEDEKLAKNIDYRSDLILSTVIRPARKIERPYAVTRMKAVLTGLKDPSLLIESDRQNYKVFPGGRVELTVAMEDLSGTASPPLPMKREDFPEELSPSLFVQSDSPLIVSRSRAVLGDERDARKASDMLVDWVYGNLKKRYSASFSNALDVLAAGKGDCTEHSVLYVALARAAGLPAREVSGVVYSDQDKGFYYHQWAEAYVGKWIAVDPTFRQHQADATHIAFARGDIFAQTRLINVFGKLGVEIEECGYASKK